MSTCQGCDKSIPPSRNGPPRKWCSDPCRKRTLYGRSCAGCGYRDNGHSGRAGKRDPYLCPTCQHERDYGARNARIVEAWERGDSAVEIAAREESTATAVSSVIEYRRRIKGQPISLHRRRNREIWPELERLWAKGLTASEIAERLGMSQESVYAMVEAMRKAGIDMPRHPQGRRPKHPERVAA